MASIDVVAYYPRLDAAISGNPLIEAFPELSKEVIENMMLIPVGYSDTERAASAEQRIQMLWRLSAWNFPLPNQVAANVDLWGLIIAGYRGRNPLSVSTTESFNKLCQAIYTGQSLFDGPMIAMGESLSAAILGTPGCGKTRTPKSLLRHFPAGVIRHPKYAIYQLLFLWVQAPDTDGYMSLLKEIYERLYQLASEAGLAAPVIKKGTRGDYEGAIVVLAAKLNLGILIIDEIQHIGSSSHKVDEKTMKFLTGLVNRLGLPVLVIGTWPALRVLGSEVRLMRRFIGPTSHKFRKFQENTTWTLFVKQIFKYQWVKSPTQFSPEWAAKFYFHTQGIHDLSIKLMILLQVEAIRGGTETLSFELLDKVIEKHWGIIAPAIRQMREGKREDDPTLWDVEPRDFEKYFQQLCAEYGLIDAIQPYSENKTADIKAKIERVAQGLQAAGVTDDRGAATLARSLVERLPNKGVAELLQTAFQEARKNQPRLRYPKSTNEAAKLSPVIMGLAEDDLRRIAFCAKQEGKEISHAFEEAGVLFEGGAARILTLQNAVSGYEAAI